MAALVQRADQVQAASALAALPIHNKVGSSCSWQPAVSVLAEVLLVSQLATSQASKSLDMTDLRCWLSGWLHHTRDLQLVVVKEPIHMPLRS